MAVRHKERRLRFPKSDICAGVRVRSHLSNEGPNFSLVLIGEPLEERSEMALDDTVFRLKCRVEEVQILDRINVNRAWGIAFLIGALQGVKRSLHCDRFAILRTEAPHCFGFAFVCMPTVHGRRLGNRG